MERRKFFLNSEWTDGEESFRVLDPGTGEDLAEVASASPEQVRLALEHAQRSFGPWSRRTALERADYLLRIAHELRRRREEIARIITRENGKPLAQSGGELDMTVDHFRWFAEEGRRAYGRVVPHQAPGKRHLVLKHPIGVVGAIPPWNFPLVLAARKVAPALAAGCPVILRPARKTPLCALELGRCAEAAGLPPGVLQVITGDSRMVAKELMDSPLCRKLSFTGSTAVGKELVRASERTLTKLSLELGGHSPVLVFADADLGRAVAGAMITKFRNTGQSCIAANRVFVQRALYEPFLEEFVARVRALRTGYGLEEGVEVGPVIGPEALQAALEQIRDACGRGARVLCGGKALDRGGGAYLEPTVLADVPDDAVCMREETFAPMAPVCAFDTEKEVIARANASRYGLAAYAFTRDLNRAWRLAEALEAGTIGINDAVPSTSNCPFGGMKESGVGRELGAEGLDAYLETKHVSFGGVG